MWMYFPLQNWNTTEYFFILLLIVLYHESFHMPSYIFQKIAFNDYKYFNPAVLKAWDPQDHFRESAKSNLNKISF